jgi:hypothetical protein
VGVECMFVESKVRRLTESLVASNDIKITTRLVALRESGVVQMKAAMRDLLQAQVCLLHISVYIQSIFSLHSVYIQCGGESLN